MSVTSMHADLGALLASGLRGDEAAYEQFLKQSATLLRRIVARTLPACDIEDVVQEILISAHKARHTYDSTRPIMPWLMAIARFRMSDQLRKHYTQMKHKQVDIADFQDRLSDVTDTPAARESMDKLLAQVPEKQQKILTMMHVEGYTAREIGQALDMKESAVKVAAHRAIKRIKAALSA